MSMSYLAKLVATNTLGAWHYLHAIRDNRSMTGNHSVILDADHCIVVI